MPRAGQQKEPVPGEPGPSWEAARGPAGPWDRLLAALPRAGLGGREAGAGETPLCAPGASRASHALCSLPPVQP